MKRAIGRGVLLIWTAGLIACGPHPNTLTFLDHQNAGDKAFIRGDYAEADNHYRLALAEAEKGGKKTPLVQVALASLGTNYLAWGKYDQAESAYKRQVAVAEKVYGPDSSGMLSPLLDITWLFLKQNRVLEAEACNQRAQGIISKLKEGERKEAVAEIEGQRRRIEQIKNQSSMKPQRF